MTPQQTPWGCKEVLTPIKNCPSGTSEPVSLLFVETREPVTYSVKSLNVGGRIG